MSARLPEGTITRRGNGYSYQKVGGVWMTAGRAAWLRVTLALDGHTITGTNVNSLTFGDGSKYTDGTTTFTFAAAGSFTSDGTTSTATNTLLKTLPVGHYWFVDTATQVDGESYYKSTTFNDLLGDRTSEYAATTAPNYHLFIYTAVAGDARKLTITDSGSNNYYVEAFANSTGLKIARVCRRRHLYRFQRPGRKSARLL